jgi:hypothetical protein
MCVRGWAVCDACCTRLSPHSFLTSLSSCACARMPFSEHCRFTPDGLILMASGLLTPRGGWQGMGGRQGREEDAGSATDMPVKLPLREAAGGESKRSGGKSKKQQRSGADSSRVLGAGKAGKGRRVSAERQREQERVNYSRS